MELLSVLHAVFESGVTTQMAGQTYALLVGINDYPSHVGRLYGCLNDLQHVHDYLRDTCERGRLHVKTLLDCDATRTNVIDQIRTHLGRARKDDVVVFHYSGHGARSKSATPFRQFFPDGWDEGLVCYDSRNPGGFDLADKELAVLLAEVARNDPHLAVILDCCHSGSATRNADDFTQLKARQTHEVHTERPLESYLNGYYVKFQNKGEPLQIPASRHILLAACQRVQKAWEGKDHRGVFTSTLLEVLGKAGPNISYADLFVRCRAAVRKRADNQDPQFETYRGFPVYAGFLGNQSSHLAHRFSVYFENNGWRVDCGALHGMPSDPDKTVELTLYPESDRSHAAGHAATTQVGAQKSDVQLLDLEADPSTRFQAEIMTLPVPPLAVHFEGDDRGRELFEKFLAASGDGSPDVLLTDAPEGARYALYAENDSYLLKFRETGKLIQGAEGYTQQAADYMLAILKQVAGWERAVVLQNQATKINPEDVSFRFCELLGDDEGGEQYVYPHGQITIDVRKEDGEWKTVRGILKANNLSQQPLYLLLVHFADDYGIQVLYNERVEPTDLDFTVTLEGNAAFNLSLDDDEGDEAFHTFKLIVSTEKVDDFLLRQEPLEIGRIFDPQAMRSTKGLTFGRPRKKLGHENEWFTKDLHIKLVRQLDRVTAQDTTLAGGKITIKGHPALQAGISLNAAKTATRGVGTGPDIHLALERQGMQLLNFSGARGDGDSILELSDIQNTETLAEDPLEIELNVDLSAGEFILPLTFDGEHLLLAGDPWQDEQGRTHVRISQIPDIPDHRRSLGQALKLYFFKTYLGQEDVNRLCWIEYKTDGSFERHGSGVAEKVAAAENVLLLIHGIIGNTDSIVQGLKSARDADGRSVNEKFDLVLTYDYENLSTPIAETAARLKQQLAEAGLRESDDKRLTLLVHSMGGLISRWFIEREGGHRVVDHLVMFGTPNNGSPFGNVDMARRLLSLLTTLALNTFPAFAPFGAALLSVLIRSQKVTPTLEQMNPDSEFIRALNSSDDPAVPYTIVAGDIRDYREESDRLIPQLIAKIGGGILFDTLFLDAGHDIAVSGDSIHAVPDLRTPASRKQRVICHHLNYFASEAGLKAMEGIDWCGIGERSHE